MLKNIYIFQYMQRLDTIRIYPLGMHGLIQFQQLN